MSVIFRPYTPDPQSDDNCPICLDVLPEESVAHGEENWHKMCRKCARAGLRILPVCPVCQQSVDLASLFSRKERMVIWLESSSKAFVNQYIAINDPLVSIGTILTSWSGMLTISAQDEPNLNLVLFTFLTSYFVGIQAFRWAAMERKEAALIASFLTSHSICLFNDMIQRNTYNPFKFP